MHALLLDQTIVLLEFRKLCSEAANHDRPRGAMGDHLEIRARSGKQA
jgi:hypothetical protein